MGWPRVTSGSRSHAGFPFKRHGSIARCRQLPFVQAVSPVRGARAAACDTKRTLALVAVLSVLAFICGIAAALDEAELSRGSRESWEALTRRSGDNK